MIAASDDGPEMFEGGDEPLADLPTLDLVRRFARAVTAVPWFAHFGAPIGPRLRRIARAYCDALGFPEVELALIRDFEEAADAAASLDWDAPAWEAEEQLRAGLTAAALERMEEETLMLALTHVSARASEAIRMGADDAAARFGVTDNDIVTAAIGAAVQACHQAALVLAAGADESHPFARKYQLFEAGRWPIGIAGTSLNLF